MSNVEKYIKDGMLYQNAQPANCSLFETPYHSKSF